MRPVAIGEGSWQDVRQTGPWKDSVQPLALLSPCLVLRLQWWPRPGQPYLPADPHTSKPAGRTSAAGVLASLVSQQSSLSSAQAHRQVPRALCCTKKGLVLSPVGLPSLATLEAGTRPQAKLDCGAVLPQHSVGHRLGLHQGLQFPTVSRTFTPGTARQ